MHTWRHCLPLLVVVLFQPVPAFTEDLNNVFNEAKSFGESKNTGLFSGISDQAVSGTIPYYGVQPAEADLFYTGKEQLSQTGVDKVSNCDGFIPSGNAVLDQECDAVNFVAKHPQVIQNTPIAPNDSIFQKTIAARSNAPAVFQSTGIMSSTDGQCTTQTETILAVNSLRSCVSLKELDYRECLAVRSIHYKQAQEPVTGEITYTVTSKDYDMGVCNLLQSNPAYQHIGSECISTAPAQALPTGITISDVAPDGCFTLRHSYAGLTGVEDNSDCELLDVDSACTYQGNGECLQTFSTNGSAPVCVDQEKNYLCTTAQAESYTVLTCSGKKYCVNGNCFNTSDAPDVDLAHTSAMMEAAREAGVYLNEDTLRVFDGDASKCRVKIGGLMNCCKSSSGGGLFNNNVLFNLSVQAGKQVLSYGSKYMYDALYTSSAPEWLIMGMSAIYSVSPAEIPAGGLLSTFSPSLSYFGFTVSLGEIAPGFMTDLTGVGILQSELFKGSGLWVGFDPTSFAISVGLMVLQELLSCDTDEQIFSLKRGENLCTRTGSYCSKRVFGICLERKQSYCCFNSRLGRIINEQGRAQLGKGWGSAKDPECSGFTQEEFASINFATLDLSEFTREIMNSISLPSVTNLGESVQDVITKRTQSYYETGSQTP